MQIVKQVKKISVYSFGDEKDLLKFVQVALKDGSAIWDALGIV